MSTNIAAGPDAVIIIGSRSLTCAVRLGPASSGRPGPFGWRQAGALVYGPTLEWWRWGRAR